MIAAIQSSIVRTFSQADFDLFARLSGDNNPIHTDTEFSARTRFGRTVAHGLLLCSVLRAQIDHLLPGAQLLEQAVMFPAPTYTGEPMSFEVTITSENQHKQGRLVELGLQVRRIEDGTLTCQGEGRVLV
jgi:acyl dehydratase